MLSRVADSIYWLNRYIERAENVARFIDVNLQLMLDIPNPALQQWQPLVLTTGDLPIFVDRYGEPSAENVIQFLTFDCQYPNSIVSCLRSARENARSIREIISSEMWEQVNDFYFFVEGAIANPPQDLHDFFHRIKFSSHLFAGVMDATMSHNEAWHFGQMGRMLERADKTSRILDVKYFILLPSVVDVGTPLDEVSWIALLKSASAYEMYRKQGLHRITPIKVAEFLILDRQFPRSINFCLRQVESSIYQIDGHPLGEWHNPLQKSIGQMRSQLEYTTIDEIFQFGLHEFLDRLQCEFNQIGNLIYETYFALKPLK